THHQLHARGQEHVLVLEAVVHAVGDRAVVVQRGEHFLDLVHDVVGTGHVEEGFLLAGERSVGQVLGGGGGTHRDGDVAAAILAAQPGVGGADVRVQRWLQRGVDHPLADLAASGGQRVDVLHVQLREPVVDALVQIVVRDEILECLGGGGEATGHRDAEAGQVPDHLAEGGILAAYACQV